MNQHHQLENIEVEGTLLHITVDGDAYHIDLPQQSRRLRAAPMEALRHVEVSPSGYGLHWPEIDEDLSIDGLLGIRHEIPRAVAEARAAYGSSGYREPLQGAGA